jgi:hypothetical protein
MRMTVNYFKLNIYSDYVTCLDCGEVNPDGTSKCGHCGANFEDDCDDYGSGGGNDYEDDDDDDDDDDYYYY